MSPTQQMSRRNFRLLLAGGLITCVGIVVAVATAGGPLTDVDAYPLENVQVGEIESKLVDLLSGVAEDAEVIADARTNRVLIRGDARVQAIAKQLIASLDQPAADQPAVEPELKTYAVQQDKLADMSQQLTRRFGATGARVAVDERTSQLIVLASPAIHKQIGQQLSGKRSAERQAEAQVVLPRSRAADFGQTARAGRNEDRQNPKSAFERRLQNISPAEFQRALQSLGQGTIRPTQQDAVSAVYTMGDAGHGEVVITLDKEAGVVQVEGSQQLTRTWVQLLAAIDQRSVAGQQTRLVSYSGAQPERVKKALSVLNTGAVTDAGQPSATAIVQRSRPIRIAQRAPAIDQQFAQNDNAPLQQPGVVQPGDAQPPVVQPGDQPPTGDETPGPDVEGQGLVGPVQIEFLEGLDVIVIRGNPRDVARVQEIIKDIERLSTETEPAIEIVQLKHIGSEVIGALLRQIYDQVLSARQGRVSINPLVKPNAILLIGRDESVKTIVDLIKRLDQPVNPASQFQVFPLRHTSAADAQSTITEFFANRTGLGPKVLVTADVRSNSVIVQAAPRDLVEVSALLARLDTPTSEAVNELRIFPLQNSLAEELAPILQSAVEGDVGTTTTSRRAQQGGGQFQQPGGQQQQQQSGGSSSPSRKSTTLRMMTLDAQGERRLRSGILTDVQVTADPRANALIVSAPAESMDLLAALIRQLDEMPTAESQIKVFTVQNADASSLVEMLRNLFGRTQNQGQGQGGILGILGGQAQGENPLVPLRFSVDQRTNSIVVSGSTADLAVVEAILLRLDDSDVRERKSTVYRLKNAPANDVATALNELLRSQRQVQQLQPNTISPFEQIEREVIVVPEPVSNSLIVSATPRFFEEIRKIVEDLDARPPMVMISVLIAEVSLNNVDEFGIELGLQDSVLFDRSLLGNLVTTTTSTTFGNPPTTVQNQTIQAASLTPGFNFNNQPLGNSGSDKALSGSRTVGPQGLTNFSVGRVNGDLGYGGLVLSASSENVSMLVRALQECRRLDVLARPQVMTLDNQPAFIQVGQRVPRVTATQTNQVGQIINSITNEDVGLILGVTPRISPDGLVVMEIDAEKSELGPESEGVPISVSVNGDVLRSPRINTTLAQTTVSALSGQTIVLGGLLFTSKTDVSRRVPLLADIPILGNLFRYDSTLKRRSELLIIMTPRVVRTEQEAEEIKKVEAARMHWCLADVIKMHGESGLRNRTDEWTDGETMTVYPDLDPTGAVPAPMMETVPTPPVAPGMPKPTPPGTPQGWRIITPAPAGEPTLAPPQSPLPAPTVLPRESRLKTGPAAAQADMPVDRSVQPAVYTSQGAADSQQITPLPAVYPQPGTYPAQPTAR